MKSAFPFSRQVSADQTEEEKIEIQSKLSGLLAKHTSVIGPVKEIEEYLQTFEYYPFLADGLSESE